MNMDEAMNNNSDIIDCKNESGMLFPCNNTVPICEENEPDYNYLLTINVVMTVIYTVIFITGFLGNICTCLVISRNRHMQTATNYYLFSLAISDLLFLLLGFPDEMNKTWNSNSYVFGSTFCWLRGLGAETSANASILIIVAFTVERWIALCHPFSRAHHGGSDGLGRATRAICGLWVLGFIFAIPQVAHVGLVPEVTCDGQPKPDEMICSVDPAYNSYARIAFQASTFLLFVFPMIIISFLYIKICVSLAKSNSYFGRQQSRLSYQSSTVAAKGRINNDPGSAADALTARNACQRLSSSNAVSSYRAGPESSKSNVVKMLGAYTAPKML
jgi:hypothetical protein